MKMAAGAMAANEARSEEPVGGAEKGAGATSWWMWGAPLLTMGGGQDAALGMEAA